MADANSSPFLLHALPTSASVTYAQPSVSQPSAAATQPRQSHANGTCAVIRGSAWRRHGVRACSQPLIATCLVEEGRQHALGR